MKANLYAVEVKGQFQWRISVNAAVTRYFWYLQGKEFILEGVSEIPLGYAFRAVAHCNQQKAAKDSVSSAVESMKAFMTAHVPKARQRHWESIALSNIATPPSIHPRYYEILIRKLAGRSILLEELDAFMRTVGEFPEAADWTSFLEWAQLEEKIELGAGMKRQRVHPLQFHKTPNLRCSRCGSGEAELYRTACASCGEERCAYCGECLSMGRVRECSLFIRGLHRSPSEPPVPIQSVENNEDILKPWGLGRAQEEAVRQALRVIHSDPPAAVSHTRQFMFWAVTGAGKTEMVFPIIADALRRGQTIAVSAPRTDVVLELAPRMKRAFPAHTVIALYGGSDQNWKSGDIVLSTTHQLLRFRDAFDRIIIDEVDAFPFHHDRKLQYAAEQALSKTGWFIYLTATPSPQQQSEMRAGRLPHARLFARYHGYPLPVPTRITMADYRKKGRRKRLPAQLVRSIERSLNREAQLFIFVPTVEQVRLFTKQLGEQWPHYRIEGTWAKDPERISKVARFRKRDSRILVSTTILERGVTIAKADVYVMNADAGVFDASALIQMAGRAGRSEDDPNGYVYFISSHRTDAQSKAIRQIKRMNREAAKQGDLKSRREQGR